MCKHRDKKQKGYVLAFVLVVSFLLVSVMATTFSIAFRYMKIAERDLEQLRQDVYLSEAPAEESND